MNGNLANFIVRCADWYYEENLKRYDPKKQELLTNWWEAFDFLLDQACYQGRSDAISYKVYCAVRDVLLPHFQDQDRDQDYDALKKGGWLALEDELGGKIGRGKIGKGRDIKMIISALRFLDRLPKRNIVAYSIARIQDGHLLQHCRELQPQVSTNGITQVGPKVAAVYLQNVVSLFKLEEYVDAESAFALVPVDTWVEQVAEKLGIVGEKERVQLEVARMCKELEIPTVRFNQGAYYAGTHAFDLLMKLGSQPLPWPSVI